MKVDIRHVEKTQGLLFKKRFYGVELRVGFTEEEKAIIAERKLQGDIVLERGIPADVNEEKYANRNLVTKIANAAINGLDANSFHLTINKLLRGVDVYHFATPLEAKNYEEQLRDQLPKLKSYIMENAAIEQKSASFEL